MADRGHPEDPTIESGSRLLDPQPRGPRSSDSQRSGFPWFELARVVVYGGGVFGMIPLHEAWRDEAQAWLMAGDLDLLGVLRQMRYEHSPPLWHLLLRPFAQLGLAYQWAHVLNACIAVGTVAIFSFASPFARWQKVAFAGCFHMAFEYGVVARSYGVSMLLGLTVAALHGRRHERRAVYGLLLLALAATNIHAMILAGSRVFVFTREPWRRGGIPDARRGGPGSGWSTGAAGVRACGGALLGSGGRHAPPAGSGR